MDCWAAFVADLAAACCAFLVVLRLAPTVHGPGDYGFIPFLISTARRTGLSAYIGEGANRWPAVHRQDAGVLYLLAIEKAPAGSTLHGVGESAIPFQTIGQLVGRMLNIPTVSVPVEKAVEHFQNPFFARAFAVDSPASSAWTRELLGWIRFIRHSSKIWRREITSLLEPSSAFDRPGH